VSRSVPAVGLLLPTFSAQCQPQRVVEAARKAERYGFHSLWVRDHLFVPEGHVHGGILESGRHLEPLIALTYAGAVTQRILLGQAVLIPLRHPLALSQALGTLSFLSGGRLLVGLGAGFNREEFAALGLPFEARYRMVQETAEILRRTWAGGTVSYKGEVFAFEAVRIEPVPAPDTPIWYGGVGTAASIRRAVTHFDGWMGGAPADVLDELLALLRRLETEEGRRRLTVSTIPLTSIAPTREAALACLDIPNLLHSMSRTMRRDYQSFTDIESALIVGTPADGAMQLAALAAKGVDVVVLDLRLAGDRFDDTLDLIGQELLPRVRQAPAVGRSRNATSLG